MTQKNIGAFAIVVMLIIIIAIYFNANIQKKRNEPMIHSQTSVEESKTSAEETYTGATFEASLRSYHFEVTDVHTIETNDGTQYLALDLKISNRNDSEQILALNSISLIIKDENDNSQQSITIANRSDLSQTIIGNDYYHCVVSPKSSAEETLFYPFDWNNFSENSHLVLHFNPYGTENAVLFGKDTNGNIIEIKDNENTADIFIEALLDGDD